MSVGAAGRRTKTLKKKKLFLWSLHDAKYDVLQRECGEFGESNKTEKSLEPKTQELKLVYQSLASLFVTD